MGVATQDVRYSKTPMETFADIQEALSMIGKVENVDKASLTVEGTCRYGLQSVKLKMKITPQGETSITSISGFSDDVRAFGAKNCIKRLLEAMDNLGNLDYKPSRIGMKPASLMFRLIGFMLLLLVVVAALENLPWLYGGVILLGFVLLIYFIIARRRFGKE